MRIEADILEVARRLQAWIDSIDTIEDPQFVRLEISDAYRAISIGDFCVWCDDDGADDLNVDTCRKKWQDHIRSMIPWLEELYIVQMPKADEHGCTLYGVYTDDDNAEQTIKRLNETEPGHRILTSIPDAPFVHLSARKKRRKP